MNKEINNFEFVSYEELLEVENNLEWNPFDTTGTGYLEEDLTEEIRKQYNDAADYYELMDKINLNK